MVTALGRLAVTVFMCPAVLLWLRVMQSLDAYFGTGIPLNEDDKFLRQYVLNKVRDSSSIGSRIGNTEHTEATWTQLAANLK